VYPLVKDRGMTLKGAQQKIKEIERIVIPRTGNIKTIIFLSERFLEEIKNEL
jgi:hypothetical protein